MSQLYIYVLRCAQGKFYVGSSRDPASRILKHKQGGGAFWTQLYPPIETLSVAPGDTFDEDKITKMKMREHGIENVRGGSYSQVCLPQYTIRMIVYELRTASGSCFRCGRAGHFANKCFAKSSADGHMLIGAPQPEPAFLQRLRNNPPPIADPIIMPAGYIDHRRKGPKPLEGAEAPTNKITKPPMVDTSVMVAVVMMDVDTSTATETTDNTFMQNINHDINELVDAVNTTASSILNTITRWF